VEHGPQSARPSGGTLSGASTANGTSYVLLVSHVIRSIHSLLARPLARRHLTIRRRPRSIFSFNV